MASRILPLFLLVFGSPLCGQDTASGTPGKVEIVGLHINKAPFGGDKDLASNMEPAPGTKLGVLVALGDGGIIRLDEDKSKITKFADDKGTDLLAAKPAKDSFFGRTIGSFPKITKDQKACLVDVQAHACPAAGAKTLQLEGMLSFSVGKDQEVLKQEKVELKKGGLIKLGSASFEIKEAGKNDFGDDPLKVSLESKDGLRVARVRFLDASGKEIESRLGSRGSFGFGGGNTIYSWDYTLKQAVSAATVEVTLWKKVTAVDVPFKLTVSLGL